MSDKCLTIPDNACSAHYLVGVAQTFIEAAEQARSQPGMEIVLTPLAAETIGMAICMVLMPIVNAALSEENIAGHA